MKYINNINKITIINKNNYNLILEKDSKFENIRLVGKNGEKLGVFNIEEAIKKSKNNNMDLILINYKENPPICKIDNYKNFIYKRNKVIKENKKKKNIIQIKEIKINQNIDNEDLKIKLNKIKSFLKKKYKVKIILKFKGREIIHKEIGFNLINNIKNKFINISNVEFMSNKIDSRQIMLVLNYKK